MKGSDFPDNPIVCVIESGWANKCRRLRPADRDIAEILDQTNAESLQQRFFSRPDLETGSLALDSGQRVQVN
jgi:hypothetical protein